MSKVGHSTQMPSAEAYMQLARSYAALADARGERGQEEECLIYIEMALVCAEEAALAPRRALPTDARKRVAEVTRADYVIFGKFVDRVFTDPRRTA